jgi:glycosyltransferase involved in cell wall biosynthesis
MAAASVRLWVISDIYYPEDVSTGYFMTRIAEGLASVADVEVLCGRPAYAARHVRVARREHRNGTTITRLGLFALPKDRLALRALNVIGFTVAVTLHLLFRLRRGDRILNVTNPPVVPPLVAALAKWRGAHFVLLVHDVFPETAVAAGLLSRDSWLFRIAAAGANSAYKRASAVVVLGRDMARLAAAKRGCDSGIKIIENWADLEEITPRSAEQNPFLAERGWTDKYVVQLSGNLGRTHDIETLAFAARGMSPDSPWRFLFAGFGGKQGVAEQAAGESSNCDYLDRQPRERLSELLAASTVHVIAFVPGMLGLSVPSRMYNVMAAGRPIIAMADAETELAMTVIEEDIGWQVNPGDSDGLVALLDRIVTGDCQEKGTRARTVAERRFGYDKVITRFIAVLGLGGGSVDCDAC